MTLICFSSCFHRCRPIIPLKSHKSSQHYSRPKLAFICFCRPGKSLKANTYRRMICCSFLRSTINNTDISVVSEFLFVWTRDILEPENFIYICRWIWAIPPVTHECCDDDKHSFFLVDDGWLFALYVILRRNLWCDDDNRGYI